MDTPIQMPIMDGYTACRRIQSNPCFEQLPIIAMTAHAMGGDRQRCLEAGMVDHIAKPIDRRHLYATLMAWIQPGDRPQVTTVAVPNRMTGADGSELPATLPGIDVAEGLDRLGNNHQVYRFLLLEFRKDFAKTAEEIRLALRGKRQDDLHAAQRLIHAIKGMSGNLSARALFRASVALEQAIKNNRQDDWPVLMDQFANTLQQVVDAIGTLQPAANEMSSVRMTPLNIEEIASHLSELANAIHKHRADAVNCCWALQPLLKGTTLEILLQNMEKSLESYLFGEAQGHMVVLCDALEIPVPQVRRA
ncbi:MAG: response regulator [Magnetococcales bacterium]|nr:response regulator [Magnetococcales bacterium]